MFWCLHVRRNGELGLCGCVVLCCVVYCEFHLCGCVVLCCVVLCIVTFICVAALCCVVLCIVTSGLIAVLCCLSQHSYLLTYLLTPWSRVLLERLTGFQLVKKFLAFYGTRRFITAFTSARHLSIS